MELLKEIKLFLIKKHKSDKISIEAFGSPGVGKSYICNKLKKNYEGEYGSILFHSIDNYNNYFLLRTLKKLIIIIKSLFLSPSLIKLVFQFLNKFENMEVKNKPDFHADKSRHQQQPNGHTKVGGKYQKRSQEF